MKVTTSVDLTAFQRRATRVKSEVYSGLMQVVRDLTREAEDYATELITVMIYDTPERGYDRTGMLRDSIVATSHMLSNDRWEIRVHARGGAGGREYASFNELGTYDLRRSFEDILAAAEFANARLIELNYGRPGKGLEPRPWVIPTAVHVAREAPALILELIRNAGKPVRR